jgi:hypothetical protein
VYGLGYSVDQVARADYAINGGTFFYINVYGPPTLSEELTYDWPDTKKVDGVSFVRSQVRMAEIIDGMSSTLLAGEKWSPNPNQAALSIGYNQPWSCGDAFDIKRFSLRPPRVDGSPNGDASIFGSPHADGTYVAMVDGSVHLVSYAIHPNVFRRLGSIRDGEIVSKDDF